MMSDCAKKASLLGAVAYPSDLARASDSSRAHTHTCIPNAVP
jgi:hypothetical protein